MNKKTKNQKNLRLKEFAQAKKQLKIAEINFNMADAEFFEVANAELSAARMKLNAIMKKSYC